MLIVHRLDVATMIQVVQTFEGFNNSKVNKKDTTQITWSLVKQCHFATRNR